MHKSFAAAAVILALSSSAAFAAGESNEGRIQFNGSIVEASCGIDSDSVDQTIQMGETPVHTLTGGGQSTPVDFKIGLVDCDASTTSADVTFQGAVWGTSGDQAKYFELPGNATAGLGLLSAGGSTVITPGTPVTKPIGPGSNTLDFQAFLIGDAVATVTPSQYSVPVTFRIAYN